MALYKTKPISKELRNPDVKWTRWLGPNKRQRSERLLNRQPTKANPTNWKTLSDNREDQSMTFMPIPRCFDCGAKLIINYTGQDTYKIASNLTKVIQKAEER